MDKRINGKRGEERGRGEGSGVAVREVKDGSVGIEQDMVSIFKHLL